MTDQQNDDLYAKHIKIQNRWVNGFYQNIRSVTIWITLLGFFLAPWIQWHGRQAILFDIAARKFYLFGVTFWPQDFFLLLLLLISAALSLIIITNLAGRIWCGYTCPQTVWTKYYMWLEYVIEGDRNKRLKRDKNPWEYSTIARRTIKHILWLLLALLTSMTFIGYFIPVHHVMVFNVNGWGSFWIILFTMATYLNAGWMREQVCLYICPYARFQSVMYDRNTMAVTYDYHRGEPRGSLKEEVGKRTFGDCIDCKLCVQVCPTGIDIREGLQMACIGCAACVDACDSVMDKVHYPRGLIRYDTENNLRGKKTTIFRLRLLASMALLCVMASTFLYLLITRIPIQLTVAHDHRNLYRITASGAIENSYVLSLDNMSQKPTSLEIHLEGIENVQFIGPKKVTLAPGESAIVPVTITTKSTASTAFNTPIYFIAETVPDHGITLKTVSNFFTPH